MNAPLQDVPVWTRLRVILAWAAGGAFALLLGLVVGFHLWAPRVVQQFQAVQAHTAENTLIYDTSDALLATIEGLEDRHTVPLPRISPYMQKAVVSIEDRRFFGHRGMDPIRIVGAIWADLQAMAFHQGGSTITQQLVKLTLLSPERTLSRKIREIFMALALERKYPKRKILEFYLNQVYFGHGVYGVEKAASAYFHKSAAELSLDESAFLAALIKKPEGYLDDARYVKAQGQPRIVLPPDSPLAERQRLVLETLRGLGWVTAAEYRAALRNELEIHRPTSPPTNAPYFVQEVMKRMRELLEVSRVSGRGFRVYTTLHPGMQAAAERTVARLGEDEALQRQGALVAMDPHSGAVRALVGGVDYGESQFNRATQALRQPGSAFKPLLYAAAFEDGYRPNTPFPDVPVRYERTTADGESEVYEPRNYGDRYGLVKDTPEAVRPLDARMILARALERSSNVIAVQLLDALGVNPVQRLAGRLGMHVRSRMGLCIALGCSEVTLENLTAAYATFANGGHRTRPVYIRRITGSEGRILYEHVPDPPEQVLSPWTAFQLNRLLQGVMRRGTGWRARLERPVGGKTGTNDGPRDTWFIGFTPNLVAGVWNGKDDNAIMPGESGGATTARLWKAFMTEALPPYQGETFPQPEEPYVAVRTCSITGKAAGEWCPASELVYYRRGEAPREACPLHQGPPRVFAVCGVSGQLVSPYCPLDTRVYRKFYAGAQPERVCEVHTPASLLLPTQAEPPPEHRFIAPGTGSSQGRAGAGRPPGRRYARRLDEAFRGRAPAGTSPSAAVPEGPGEAASPGTFAPAPEAAGRGAPVPPPPRQP